MITLPMLASPIFGIRANLPPFGPPACPPWRAPCASTPKTSQTVCKLVALKTPTDIRIPFLFNLSSTLRLRRRSTEGHISPLCSCSSRPFPSQRTGTPPPQFYFPLCCPECALRTHELRFFAQQVLYL